MNPEQFRNESRFVYLNPSAEWVSTPCKDAAELPPSKKCIRCGKRPRDSRWDSWLCASCGVHVWGRVAEVAEWMYIWGWRPL